MVAPPQTMVSCVRNVTPTVQVTVPHPAPVIREAAPTVAIRRRRSYRWPAITFVICLASFAVGAFGGHVVKADSFRKAAAPVLVRTARASEVITADVLVESARPRAPIAPAPPQRTARRAPAKVAAQPSSTSDLELAFRAELHP